MNALPREPLPGGVAPARTAMRCFTLTFGATEMQKDWTDRRTITWTELGEKLTRHEVGPKEGPCIVPATFRGTRRQNADADQIDLVVLDADCGHTLEEITSSVLGRGWAAIIHSTHSHLTRTTQAKRNAWDKFCDVHPVDTERRFLIAKGYLPRIAEGARVTNITDTEVTLEHAPCPKFRIVLRLARSWRAADFPDQNAANTTWKERIEALAAALGLSHDQSCTDTSRLFYLPRHPDDGRKPAASIIEGADCDIWTLPSAKPAKARDWFGAKPAATADADEFINPETGEIIHLPQWAKVYGKQFELVKALKARRPDVFVGHIANGTHHHIRCVNEDAHTTTDTDRATFIVNASEANNKGFVIHCRHAHCHGKDRLFFVRRMLECGWLKAEDLTSAEFLTMTEEAAHRREQPPQPDDAAAEQPNSSIAAEGASTERRLRRRAGDRRKRRCSFRAVVQRPAALLPSCRSLVSVEWRYLAEGRD